MQLKSQKRYRLFLLVLVYIVITSIGIRFGVFQEISRGSGFFYTLILGLILTKICIIDSRVMGKPLSIFSYWLIFIFYGIAVPICVVRAHGFKGLYIVFAHFVALTLIFILSWFVTSCIVYGTSFLYAC